MPTSALRQMNGPTSNDAGSSLSGGNSGSRSTLRGRRFAPELVIGAPSSQSRPVYERAVSAERPPARPRVGGVRSSDERSANRMYRWRGGLHPALKYQPSTGGDGRQSGEAPRGAGPKPGPGDPVGPSPITRTPPPPTSSPSPPMTQPDAQARTDRARPPAA